MKLTKALTIIFLIFSFHNFVKADDIRDFEIEGMSIGDSLLDFFTQNEIKNYTKDYYANNPNFEFIAIEILDNSFKQYSGLQIHVKKNDKRFIIQSISGFDYFLDDIKDCYTRMKVVEDDFEKIFSNLKKRKTSFDHSIDPTGKSKVTAIYYTFENGDSVGINCYDWSKEMNYGDNFDITLDTKEFFHAASKL